MTTPNSTTAEPTVDLHQDAMATDDFGTNVGDLIEQTNEMIEVSGVRQESRCNVGRTEQKLRIGAGAALLAAAAFAPVSRGWRIGFGILGAAQLISGTTRYCPVSKALGINTCRDGEE